MGKLEEVIKRIEGPDRKLMEKTQVRLDHLTKPLGSLGMLEELAKKLVGITRNEEPSILQKVIITMAADHGVVEERVSAYPAEVTAQMVYNFLRGGAGINVLSRHIGARVVVVDMGVAADLNLPEDSLESKLINKKIAYGTKNMTKGPAMSPEQARQAIEAGIEIVEEEKNKGIDLLGTGDMGIGNTTASSAIVASFLNKSVEEVSGRGTGIDDATFKHKVMVIRKALEVNHPDSSRPIDVLAKVGGFEIGGLAGVILAGASLKIPVVIDGFISGAASLIACALEPKVKDYLIAGHCSVERGHRLVLQYLGLKPLLDLNLRLGEGTGAVLAMGLIEAGVKILKEMATFKEAGVSEKNGVCY